MSETEFIELGRRILSAIDTGKAASTFNEKELRVIQAFIINNPNNKYVQDFISVFVGRYINLFFTPTLVEAFNMDESIHYYKELQIAKNLPYTAFPWYSDYLHKVLNIPSDVYGKLYRILAYVIKTYAPNIAKDPHIQSVLDFIEQNPKIIRGGQDIYYSLEREKELYELSLRGIRTKELEDFENMEQLMDGLDAFINKRKGNIGELYAFGLINAFKILVAKDVKNGFGYDIYYYDAINHIENLVEVKTSTMSGDDDYFSMSENEYRIMLECANNPRANYVIYRVRLDSTLTPSCTTLAMKDSSTLIDPINPEIQYILSSQTIDSLSFKRLNPNRK